MNRVIAEYGDDRVPMRIWNHIYPCPITGCWLWGASTDRKGYGRTSYMKRSSVGVHRLLYILLGGVIPAGLVLDHECDTEACSNPDHLTPKTHRENILRGTAPSALRARQTHCSRGHLLSGPDADVFLTKGTNSRQCRTCARLLRTDPERKAKANASRRARRAERGGVQTQRTHCRHGHELSEENVYVTTAGVRRCRNCRTEASGRYRSKGVGVTRKDDPKATRFGERKAS